MEVIILILAMLAVGFLVGWTAGFIWPDRRPIGVQGDYIASIITTLVVGFMDWYIIPAMGFGDTVRFLGVAFEPLLGAFLVLWIIRQAKK